MADRKDMEIFARIIETEKTQVLYFIDYDPDKEETCFHQVCIVDGIKVDTKLIISGEDQENAAIKMLNSRIQKDADQLVNKLLEIMN